MNGRVHDPKSFTGLLKNVNSLRHSEVAIGGQGVPKLSFATIRLCIGFAVVQGVGTDSEFLPRTEDEACIEGIHLRSSKK